MHSEVKFHAALADLRLLNSADVHVTTDLRYLNGQVHGHLRGTIDARKQIHVDANIQVGELGVDQRIDTDPSYARLETACRGRDFFTDFQSRLEIVYGANLR